MTIVGSATSGYRPSPVRKPVSLERTFAGRFERVGKFSSGSYGDIHLAVDRLSGRHVALKIFPLHIADHLIDREVEAMVRLPEHKHLPSYIDHGTDAVSRRRWMAMEFIDGHLLSDVIDKRERLPLFQALDIAKQTCTALSLVNDFGGNMVHRDLKPDNIFIQADGLVKIADFGSSLIDHAGAIVGSPGYMSPEQLHGRELDFRSDLYSLGIMVYEMLHGRNPMVRDISDKMTVVTMIQALRGTARAGLPQLGPISTDPAVQSLLQEFVNKLTAYEPADRYESYEAVIAAAEAIEARMAAVAASAVAKNVDGFLAGASPAVNID